MHGCSSRYTLHRDVSNECLCWPYCTTTGDHGRICSKATPSPPFFYSNDDDGDDDDAFEDDDDGDDSSTDEMST